MASSNVLYDLSVPVFVRGLTSLLAFLKKGEQWCEDNNVDKKTLLEGKIAPDMKPLPFQIQGCSNTSKGVVQRVGGVSPVAMADDEETFEQIYARIEKTIALLQSAQAANFQAADSSVVLKLGPSERTFVAVDYVQTFALPNFFFHEAMAYAILRQAGVPVGKRDFLGGS